MDIKKEKNKYSEIGEPTEVYLDVSYHSACRHRPLLPHASQQNEGHL